MSLAVTPELVEAAQQGQLDDGAFIDCVRTSLPYAYGVVAGLAGRVPAGGVADNQVAPPDDRTQGELLRAMASTSIRSALEQHFGVRIAFQNCHRVAVFAPGASGYDEFTSPAAQVLNQTPELVNC